MQFLLAFLEGIITFISPCMLPMLPVYVFYFASDVGNGRKTLQNAIGFVLGFTAVFVSLGAFAGALGGFLIRYQSTVNIVAGLFIILLGLSYTELLPIPLLQVSRRLEMDPKKLRNLTFFSSVLFGVVFSVGWTPCVGAFLGTALMMAASSGQHQAGIVMLLCYSLGLGIPFIASALLINRLKATFDWIKRQYRILNLCSGIFLILIGIGIMTGWMGRILSALSFNIIGR